MVRYVIVFILVVTVNAADGIGQCFDRSDSYSIQNQTIHIGCPKGSVIYDPNITASAEECGRKAPGCLGKPIELTVDVNECFWKTSCHIKFPTGPIFTQRCVDNVKSLHVYGWKCIKTTGKRKQINFINGICNGGIKTDLSQTGVVVSHSNLPWYYSNSMFRGSNNTIRTCVKNISGESGNFVVSTDMFDIDQQHDTLYINDLSVTHTAFHGIFQGNISITFNGSSTLSKGGSGFVICYKNMNSKTNETESACKGLIDQSKCSAYPSSLQSFSGYKCNACSKRKLKKRCNNCQGVRKCNRKYRKTCPVCCPGKNILKKCRKRKWRKGRKNKQNLRSKQNNGKRTKSKNRQSKKSRL